MSSHKYINTACDNSFKDQNLLSDISSEDEKQDGKIPTVDKNKDRDISTVDINKDCGISTGAKTKHSDISIKHENKVTDISSEDEKKDGNTLNRNQYNKDSDASTTDQSTDSDISIIDKNVFTDCYYDNQIYKMLANEDIICTTENIATFTDKDTSRDIDTPITDKSTESDISIIDEDVLSEMSSDDENKDSDNPTVYENKDKDLAIGNEASDTSILDKITGIENSIIDDNLLSEIIAEDENNDKSIPTGKEKEMGMPTGGKNKEKSIPTEKRNEKVMPTGDTNKEKPTPTGKQNKEKGASTGDKNKEDMSIPTEKRNKKEKGVSTGDKNKEMSIPAEKRNKKEKGVSTGAKNKEEKSIPTGKQNTEKCMPNEDKNKEKSIPAGKQKKIKGMPTGDKNKDKDISTGKKKKKNMPTGNKNKDKDIPSGNQNEGNNIPSQEGIEASSNISNNGTTDISRDAVFVRSEAMPDSAIQVEGYDFNFGVDYHALFSYCPRMGFQATSFGKAVKEINRMIQCRQKPMPQKDRLDISGPEPSLVIRNNCTIFLGYTSNMASCGVRETIRFLAQHRLIDCIVTTAGGIEEDLIKCLAPTYIGDWQLLGKELRMKGINRIGNLLVPNENYCKFEDWVMPQLDKMLEEQKTEGTLWAPSRVIARLGEAINDPSSITYWAWKNNIPVFSPALTDGSLGDMMYFHSIKSPGLVLDIISDLRRINDLAKQSINTGMVIVGGGVIKHHICNANLMRNGADFSVFLNTASEWDGSDSGARPDEAISWGKIKIDADPVKIYGEASFVFPLLVGETFAKYHHSCKCKLTDFVTRH